MKVLKFGAVWCPGCLIMRPRWEEIEKDNTWLKNEYYDFDQDKNIVEKYNITQNLPVFIFLDKEGNEIIRLSGELSKKKILELIENNKNK
jgi:thiol-disulfide isomerase/thioredoxin